MSGRNNQIDHNSSPDPNHGRWVVRRIREHSDTQRSLEEASAALENAFDHIRHVRHNLLRLAETYTEPLTAASNVERHSVNPGHQALVLSGGSPEEREDEDTTAFESRTLSLSSPNSSRPRSTTVMHPSTPTQAPPLPPALPPRLYRQNLYGLPVLTPDSAATSHGLRVAAREANANNPRALGILQQSHAMEYERIRQRTGRAIFQNRPFHDDFSFRSITQDRPHNSSSLPVYPTFTSRNVYHSLDPSHRLNYLPIPPLPPPGRAIQRPLGTFPDSPRPRPATVDIVGPSDEWSDENLNFTDDHRLISWLFPSQEDTQLFAPRRDLHIPDSVRTTRETGPTSRVQPGRRGWARLDPDGNEISWDEEEALERSRTEYRMRVLQHTREGSNGPEILRHDGRTFHGSVLDSMLSVPATRPRTNRWQSRMTDPPSPSLWVDPLPMPLSSMVMKEDRDDCHPDVIVPRCAFLAGR